MRDEFDAAVRAAEARYTAAKAALLSGNPYALLERPVAGPGGPRLRERQANPLMVEYRAAEESLRAAQVALNRHRRATAYTRRLGVIDATTPRPAA